MTTNPQPRCPTCRGERVITIGKRYPLAGTGAGALTAPCPHCTQEPSDLDADIVSHNAEQAENRRRLGLWEELVAALEACKHMEEVYEMWRTDDDEGFANAQIADGYYADGIGHEYLEGLRDKAMSLTNAVLSRIQPQPSGEAPEHPGAGS